MFKGLVSETLGVLEPVSLVSEALLLIRRHWVRVWGREPADFGNIWPHVQNDNEFDRQKADTWPKLCSLECAAAAVKLRGKAAGGPAMRSRPYRPSVGRGISIVSNLWKLLARTRTFGDS